MDRDWDFKRSTLKSLAMLCHLLVAIILVFAVTRICHFQTEFFVTSLSKWIESSFLRTIHMDYVYNFLISTNRPNLCEIQCKHSYGTIATITLDTMHHIPKVKIAKNVSLFLHQYTFTMHRL